MTPAWRRGEPAGVRIPAELAGPVAVALARSVDQIPAPKALPGGSRYEVKWDGYRVAIIRSGDRARLWTRNRHEISDRFPDIVTAAVRQLPDGVVLDGELVILGADGRLSFDALQQRLVTSPARARAKAAELPASFAAFDLLAAGGVDLRTQRWTVRRQRLEQLARGWVPPLQLTPVTADLDEATEWFEVLPAAMGVEGLVVMGAATRYTPGRRDAWVKVNSVRVGGVRHAGLRTNGPGPSMDRGGSHVNDTCRRRRFGALRQVSESLFQKLIGRIDPAVLWRWHVPRSGGESGSGVSGMGPSMRAWIKNSSAR